MNSFYDQSGARIRQLRELNRYSREKFAEIADISPKFLYEIETGQKGFSADTLYRIASALSVSCEYILCGVSPANSLPSDLADGLQLFSATKSEKLAELMYLIYALSSTGKDNGPAIEWGD